ncbi:MAG: hypothetical protein DKINENOH_05379 [bacterium]|nr:hypothetical protein [bacterium]
MPQAASRAGVYSKEMKKAQARAVVIGIKAGEGKQSPQPDAGFTGETP